jgi:hypothetical protein
MIWADLFIGLLGLLNLGGLILMVSVTYLILKGGGNG